MVLALPRAASASPQSASLAPREVVELEHFLEDKQGYGDEVAGVSLASSSHSESGRDTVDIN